MTARSRTRCWILLIAALTILSVSSVSGCATGGLFGAKEPPKQPETVSDWVGLPRPE
jgi:hypothetical protein